MKKDKSIRWYDVHPWHVAFGYSSLVMMLDIAIIVAVAAYVPDHLKAAFIVSFSLVLTNTIMFVVFIRHNTN